MNIPVLTVAKEFKVVKDENVYAFNKEVNDLLKDGWVLFGATSSLVNEHRMYLIQSLIKE